MKKNILTLIITSAFCLSLIQPINAFAAKINKDNIKIENNLVNLNEFAGKVGKIEKKEVGENDNFKNYPKYKYVLRYGDKVIEIYEDGSSAYINGKYTPLSMKQVDGYNVEGDSVLTDKNSKVLIPVDFMVQNLNCKKDKDKLVFDVIDTTPVKPDNGDKDSMNKPTDTPNKPNGSNNGNQNNGNSETPSKPNPSKPNPSKPNPPKPNPPKPNPPKPNPPKPTPPPIKPDPPKPTPPPIKPDPPKEKVYTGRNAVQTLLNKGYTGNSGSAYYTDGSMEVMRMSALSGQWDMIYSTQSFDPVYGGHHQAFCNAMMPGYGGSLYNLLRSGKNQTTKLGGRTVQVVMEAYGVKLRISPING